jgi:L-ascorbate metabolism protein UlaG (beta-lactamase superfamily)
MQVEWHGQSAFRLIDGETTVFIDPFADMSELAAARGMQFDYPPIEGVEADLLLVTHEHHDHNCVEAIGGDPTILRSTAGRLESPIGEVLAVSSEHDEHAGTERGPNTIFVFDFGGVRCAHFGDFGQSALREEQAEAIGTVELLFIPVGDGPTIGGQQAAAISERLEARWIVPMHYRTPRVNFLEPADAFLERIAHVERLDEPGFDTDRLAADRAPLAVVPAAP